MDTPSELEGAALVVDAQAGQESGEPGGADPAEAWCLACDGGDGVLVDLFGV